jgi:hypothetical protein
MLHGINAPKQSPLIKKNKSVGSKWHNVQNHINFNALMGWGWTCFTGPQRVSVVFQIAALNNVFGMFIRLYAWNIPFPQNSGCCYLESPWMMSMGCNSAKLFTSTFWGIGGLKGPPYHPLPTRFLGNPKSSTYSFWWRTALRSTFNPGHWFSLIWPRV